MSQGKATMKHFLTTVLCAAAVVCTAARAQSALNDYDYSRGASFTYYGVGDGGKAGLVRTETVEPDTESCVQSTYDYDAQGNRTSATTANCVGAVGDAVFVSRTSTSGYTAAASSQTITVGTGSASVPMVPGLFPARTTATVMSGEFWLSERVPYVPYVHAILMPYSNKWVSSLVVLLVAFGGYFLLFRATIVAEPDKKILLKLWYASLAMYAIAMAWWAFIYATGGI